MEILIENYIKYKYLCVRVFSVGYRVVGEREMRMKSNNKFADRGSRGESRGRRVIKCTCFKQVGGSLCPKGTSGKGWLIRHQPIMQLPVLSPAFCLWCLMHSLRTN